MDHKHMAVYFARWKDGSFSIVEAGDQGEAYKLLDEFGDEPAELSALRSCLIDFELTDRGSFRLVDFGEVMRDEMLNRGYPVLQAAFASIASQEYEPDQDNLAEQISEVPEEIAKAVQTERQRFCGFRPSSATTELARIFRHTRTCPDATLTRSLSVQQQRG